MVMTWNEIVTADPRELVVAPPFSGLFPVDARVSDALVESMRENGYDSSKPINVWLGRNVVVDGHTRRHAAIRAGIREVPVSLHEFKDEDEAFDYAVRSQRDRRQITDADILRLTELLDRRNKAGRPKKEFAPSGANSVRTSEETAKKLKTSRHKVEAARRVLDNAEEHPDVKEEVATGKLSLRAADRKIGDRKRKKRGGYTPITFQTEERTEATSISSVVSYDEQTRAWLDSFPLRAKVVAHRFDEDAMIYRKFSSVVGTFRSELRSLIGDRSEAGQTFLYRALLRVSPLPSVDTWTLCKKCQGDGEGEAGPCRACRGGGYVIPGFERS